MRIGCGCYHTVNSATLGSEMGMSRVRIWIKKATQRGCSTGSVEEGNDWPGRFFSCSLFMNRLLSVCHVPDWLSIKHSNNNIYYAFSLCQTLFWNFFRFTNSFNCNISIWWCAFFLLILYHTYFCMVIHCHHNDRFQCLQNIHHIDTFNVLTNPSVGHFDCF